MGASAEWMRGGLEWMILKILAQEPSYGYLIQKQLQTAHEQWEGLQISTLYRSLHRLEAAKQVKSRWDRSTVPARKWYEITAAGRRKLDRQSSQWRQQAEFILRMLGHEPGKTSGPQAEPT